MEKVLVLIGLLLNQSVTFYIFPVGVTLNSMKEPMCTHLSKRGSTYYFRRKSPVDLTHIFGKEVMISLGTKDKKEAEILVRKMGSRYDEKFSEARAEALGVAKSAPLSLPPQLVKLKPPRFDADLEIKDAHIYAARFLNLLKSRRERAFTEGRFKDFQDDLTRVHGDAEEYLRTGLHPFEDNPEPVWKLAAQLQAIKAIRDNVELPYQEVTHVAKSSAISISTASSLSLHEIVSKWAAERKPQPRTITKMNRVIDRFIEMTGVHEISSVTKINCIDFKDGLLAAGSTPANVNQYLTELNTLLNFASIQALIDSSPATGLKVKTNVSAKTKRLPFDLPALKLIFNSPVYTSSQRPIGGKGEASYWLPILALFTGARLNELCQSLTDDVYIAYYHDDDNNIIAVWVLEVTNEGEDQKLKNDGSRRVIPIHAELIKLGFITYVQSLKKGLVFPELTSAGAYDSLSANWSKWFGRYLRNTILVSDKRMVFHSFRHCFKDYARAASIPADVHNALTGHSSGSAADNYGSDKYPLRPLAEAMAKYRVMGLVVPPRV